MSFGEARRVCRVCKKKNLKDLKAALLTGRPIYFTGLKRAIALAISRKWFANLEIQYWNKSGSIQLTLTERKFPER